MDLMSIKNSMDQSFPYWPVIAIPLVGVAVAWFIRRLLTWKAMRGLPAGSPVPAPAYAMASLVFWVTVIGSVLVASEFTGLGLVHTWLKQFAALAPRFAGAAVVMVIGWQVARILRLVLPKSAAIARLQGTEWIVRAASGLVLLITLLVALEQLGAGVEVASQLVTSLMMLLAGSLALTLALGSREIVADILGAYQLKKVYKPGQRLVIDGKEGNIQQITATEMILETNDGELRVPGAIGAHSSTLRLYEKDR